MQLCMKDAEFLRKFHYKVLVVDEAHRLKNRSSLLHQTLLQVNCLSLLFLDSLTHFGQNELLPYNKIFLLSLLSMPTQMAAMNEKFFQYLTKHFHQGGVGTHIRRQGGQYIVHFVGNLFRCRFAKNYRNRLTFDEVIAKTKRVQFSETQCISEVTNRRRCRFLVVPEFGRLSEVLCEIGNEM